jgi:hypothetical protein
LWEAGLCSRVEELSPAVFRGSSSSAAMVVTDLLMRCARLYIEGQQTIRKVPEGLKVKQMTVVKCRSRECKVRVQRIVLGRGVRWNGLVRQIWNEDHVVGNVFCPGVERTQTSPVAAWRPA